MGAGYHGGFGNTKGSAHNNESANTPKKESRADLISELRKNNIKFSEKDEGVMGGDIKFVYSC